MKVNLPDNRVFSLDVLHAAAILFVVYTMHNPALISAVIHCIAAFRYQFLQVAKAERIDDIPTDAL